MTHPTGHAVTSHLANTHACGCGQQLFAVTTTGDAALIRAGVVDGEAIRAFTTGQCHAFAYALHEATGWPIVAVAEADHDWMTFFDLLQVAPNAHDGARHMSEAYLDKLGSHFFVQHPDGTLIDIRGRTTPDAYLEWAGYRGAPHDPRWYPSPDGTYDVDDIGTDGQDDDPDCVFVGAKPEALLAVYANRRTPAIDAARTLVPTVLASLEDSAPGSEDTGHVTCDVCALAYPAVFEDRCPNAWRGTKDKTKDTRYQLPAAQHQAARDHIERYRAARDATRA